MIWIKINGTKQIKYHHQFFYATQIQRNAKSIQYNSPCPNMKYERNSHSICLLLLFFALVCCVSELSHSLIFSLSIFRLSFFVILKSKSEEDEATYENLKYTYSCFRVLIVYPLAVPVNLRLPAEHHVICLQSLHLIWLRCAYDAHYLHHCGCMYM